MNVNIREFSRIYAEEYEAMHNATGYVAGYDEAVTAFDEFCAAHGDFVGEFARYRGDYITSDREAAAFAFALDRMGVVL